MLQCPQTSLFYPNRRDIILAKVVTPLPDVPVGSPTRHRREADVVMTSFWQQCRARKEGRVDSPPSRLRRYGETAVACKELQLAGLPSRSSPKASEGWR